MKPNKANSTYKLLLKTHRITKMKYLCVTRKSDYSSYTGSGTYWSRHLKKHGYEIDTELLYESASRDDKFIDRCIYYSKHFDVVSSDEFANLIPEDGNSSWKNKKQMSEEGKKNLIAGVRKFWNSEEGKKCKKDLSRRSREWFADPKNQEAIQKRNYKLKQVAIKNSKQTSISVRQRFASMTESEKKEYGDLITAGRHRMSDEAKQKRATRIGEAFKNSEARKKFVMEMKTARRGGGNPAARSIIWHGNKFETAKSFKEYIRLNNLNKSRCFEILKDPSATDCYYENPREKSQIEKECPFCKKRANDSSAFRRWHFENCRSKI